MCFGGVRIELLGVRFRDSGPPDVALGETVVLRFHIPEHEPLVTAHAIVVRRDDHEGHCYVGFRFSNRSQLEDQLSVRLYGLFNRRRAFRVEPGASPETMGAVALESEDTDLCVRGQLVDLSVAGVGVRVPLECERVFARGDAVTVTLWLPNYEERIRVPGNIHQRRVVSVAAAHYGIEFKFEHSPETEKQQGAIVAYVLQRQRAARRMR
jgi:hypothetical protein